jgi:hypothetical protein
MLDDQLVSSLIFWTGSDGCGILESESPKAASTLIRKVLIPLILSPRNYFIHELTTLREEFICAAAGGLINVNIRFLSGAQKHCFAREDEIRGDDSADIPKAYGLQTFVPPSLTDSDEYWRHVAMKYFALSTQLRPPTLCLTLTMNPNGPDYHSLKR